ncbi:MAG: hypothetical protein GC203_19220 [Phenylobacterium sp.]|uniref:hypothetical protein n=1 Tax=Phenylobacterium sp. TaxID=1871053 RepID=UPI0025F6DD71|nr:hypothetical protein [Phenylobacterium sp.]MBI1199994.1 hypothetical protein [Phenylobacterium sp.]
MTMVGAAACQGFAVLISDRLVTLSRQGTYAGPHDLLANKTVVYLGRDCALIFGFAGTAYLAGIPTDEWIAQVLWGKEFQRYPDGRLPTAVGGKGDGPRGLNQVLLTLRRKLSVTPGGKGVTLLVSGWWSRRRRRLIPILVKFSGNDAGFASPTMKLRPPRSRINLAQEVIGILPTADVIQAAQKEPRPQPRNGFEYADYVISIFTSVIRRTAASDPGVGPHVTAVTIPHPSNRRVTCRFDPFAEHSARIGSGSHEARIPVAFTPWVVSELGFQSAMVLSGIQSFKRKFGSWTIEYLGCPPRVDIDTSVPSFIADQQRRPMPG